MVNYQTARRKAESPPPPEPQVQNGPIATPLRRSASDSAAASLAHGFARAQNPIRHGASLFNLDAAPSSTPSGSAASDPPASDIGDLRSARVRPPTEDELLEQDKFIVEREFTRYLEAGLSEMRSDGLNQLIYWEVQ